MKRWLDKYADGGEIMNVASPQFPIAQKGKKVKYSKAYIDKLKAFENTSDNLSYHVDNKKIPTIGWGHRLTEEELKRRAVKLGKEWVSYDKFSGKSGIDMANKLLDHDINEHYGRLEKQVGASTLDKLPVEVKDVLLDITFNRGSLGDSLNYVKKNDISGLSKYLLALTKDLDGGARKRMLWRAERTKSISPVRAMETDENEGDYMQYSKFNPSPESIKMFKPYLDKEKVQNGPEVDESYQEQTEQEPTLNVAPIYQNPVQPVPDLNQLRELLKLMMLNKPKTDRLGFWAGGPQQQEQQQNEEGLVPIAQQGEIIKDNNGYWNPNNWGKPVQIRGNKNGTNITMKGNIPYKAIMATDETGYTQIIPKGYDAIFPGSLVTEVPIAQNGKSTKGWIYKYTSMA